MRSLYDLLGVRADDDEQVIKNAFRKAAKAHHPDLNPDDPDAARRFTQIVSASIILRNAQQRAAYDQQLELEREQLKRRLDRQQAQLRRERRQTWLTRLCTAAAVGVVSCGLIGGYRLFTPTLLSGILAVMLDRPDAGLVPADDTVTIVETIRNGEGADSTAGPDGRENVPAETKMANVPLMPRADGADADIADGTLATGAAAFTGDAAAVVADPGAPQGSTPTAMPNDSRVYRRQGIVAYRLGDFPGAIADLDEAIRLDPNDAQAFNIRGNAWDEIGVFDRALADYNEAIRIDPDNPAIFHDRAILWHRKGELDKALLDLDRAIRFSFSDPNVYCARGLVWYEKGRHERAIADFNQAIKLDSGVAGACITRGLILHGNSDFAVAFADLGRTIHVSSDVFDVSRKLKHEN